MPQPGHLTQVFEVLAQATQVLPSLHPEHPQGQRREHESAYDAHALVGTFPSLIVVNETTTVPLLLFKTSGLM